MSALPTTFAELGDDTATGGLCPRCGDTPEVNLIIKAEQPRQANHGRGPGATIKRDKVALCERCAVELFVTVARGMRSPRRENGAAPTRQLPGAASSAR